MKKLSEFAHDETGATAIEYALIAAATGLAMVAVMPGIKASLIAVYNTINGTLQP